ARDGGVLVRAGHTEAAVDIAQLAGLNPSGVICEIMNDDGSMARLPDLLEFARVHQLNIATIADLIAYRRRYEKLIERVLTMPFTSKAGGEFTLMLYRDVLSGAEHAVLQKGRVDSDTPTLVRMHSSDFLNDILQDATNPKAGDLQRAMHMLEREGNGLVVILRHPMPGVLSEQLLARQRGEAPTMDLRAYGIGAQILLDLGVRDMVLITSSPRPVVGLEGYGLNIVGHHLFEER
ncbi:MAG: 3,4-dihydroxy-2-butanone-4-phosphate synthase, partial [Rickettsiales bacterium]|nr:3,4-dihydroxy-2-butanone-4-phosphate synthase [Rickettsiales bacterium]